MSEKRKIQRFNLDEGRIWEVIEGLSPFKTTYTLEEVCEKLNEQQDIIGEQKIAIDELITDYKKLEKENEQLQKELQRFKKYVFSQDNILCYKCEHCIKKDIYVVDCEMKGEVDVHGLCSLFREVKV